MSAYLIRDTSMAYIVSEDTTDEKGLDLSKALAVFFEQMLAQEKQLLDKDEQADINSRVAACTSRRPPS